MHVGRDFKKIGFWPPKLFTELKGFTSQVACGGEAFSSVPTLPPMGSGHFPGCVNIDKDAYCSKNSILDFVGKTHDPGTLVSEFEDAHALYRVLDEPITNKAFGHTVFFGGPDSNK
nr:uncharacterized protein LOC108942972 [Nicotiana tomentosiformis]